MSDIMMKAKKTIKCCQDMADRLIEVIEAPKGTEDCLILVVYRVYPSIDLPSILHMRYCPFCCKKIEPEDK